MKYILAIDQSTSGTKALLFDEDARLIGRSDLPHKQKISENGWVAHDPMEIWENTKGVARAIIEKTGINKDEVIGIGISNQRETALVWDRDTGLPVYDAIVWQCARGAKICEGLSDYAEMVREHTRSAALSIFLCGKDRMGSPERWRPFRQTPLLRHD